jgi:hypothetical protein
MIRKVVRGRVVYVKEDLNKSSNNVKVGGAFSEVKTKEEKMNKDKLKNFSVAKTAEKKGSKMSADKLNKFIDLKL